MKKITVVDYFSQSKKWPPRIPKIKKITKNSLKIMKPYFYNKKTNNISKEFLNYALPLIGKKLIKTKSII